MRSFWIFFFLPLLLECLTETILISRIQIMVSMFDVKRLLDGISSHVIRSIQKSLSTTETI